MLLSVVLLILPIFRVVTAGSVDKGGACDNKNNRLQTGSYQFWSECNSVTFCNSSNMCSPKHCRHDDFPFGYAQGARLPEKCPLGQFCPDEGSLCQPLQPVGSPCQLNRDDQCEGPPNFKELADTSRMGLNVNGSVCLLNTCMWANATLGTACVVENTPYTEYGLNGKEFGYIVSRGNCRIGLYCDSSQKVCMRAKALGVSCTADKECESFNCLSSGVCGVSASTPRQFDIYVYVLVALGIFGAMGGTLAGLFFTHRRQRDVEREKRIQYWREQNAFHQNLQQMRETARASLLSLPNNNGSSIRTVTYVSDDSRTPIMAPKASGLRNYLSDNGSTEFDEGPMMHHHSGKSDGRF